MSSKQVSGQINLTGVVEKFPRRELVCGKCERATLLSLRDIRSDIPENNTLNPGTLDRDDQGIPGLES